MNRGGGKLSPHVIHSSKNVSQGPNWQRVKEIFDAALERPVAERAAFIVNACGDDGGLRDDVESLLSAHAQAGSFLSQPALSWRIRTPAPPT